MNDEEEIKKAWEEISQAEREQSDTDSMVLNVARLFLSENEFNDLEILMTESDDTSYYSIENEPRGEYQKDPDYNYIKGYWVNQTTNGGYIGDEYDGTISVKLSNGQYFQFNYSM